MLLLYFAPRSDIPDDGAVVVQQNGDGSFLLSWTELDGADGYQVEILQLMEPDKDDRLTYQRVMTNGSTEQLFGKGCLTAQFRCGAGSDPGGSGNRGRASDADIHA